MILSTDETDALHRCNNTQARRALCADPSRRPPPIAQFPRTSHTPARAAQQAHTYAAPSHRCPPSTCDSWGRTSRTLTPLPRHKQDLMRSKFKLKSNLRKSKQLFPPLKHQSSFKRNFIILKKKRNVRERCER
jgi:hypothetical protein